MRSLLSLIKQKKAIVVPLLIVVIVLLVTAILLAVCLKQEPTESDALSQNDGNSVQGENTDNGSIDAGTEPTDDGYRVDYIELDNGIRVTASVESESVLRIDFVNEKTGELYGQAEQYIYEYETDGSTEVNFDTPEDIPAYYLIEGYITDGEGNMLSRKYECVLHTETYQKVLNAQPEDFEDCTIGYFSGGFGVYNSRVKLIDGFQKEENGACYFSPFDAGSLNVGDYVGDAYHGVALKIKSIDVTEDAVILYPDEDAELTDFYDFYKAEISTFEEYEKEQDDTETDVDYMRTSDTSYDIRLLGAETENTEAANTDENDISVNIFPEGGYSKHFKANLGSNVSADAGVDAKITTKVTVLYDFRFFSDDFFYSSVVADFTFQIGASLYTEDTADVIKSIKLPELSVGTGIAGLKAFCKIEPYFRGTLDAEAHTAGTFVIRRGYETYGKGIRTIAPNPNKTLGLVLKGEAELSVGIALDFGLDYLHTVSCDVTIDPCFVLSAEANGKAEAGNMTEEEDIKHNCALCLKGDASFAAASTIGVKVNVLNLFEFESKRIPLLTYSRPIKIFDGKNEFYISVINEADSCFGGKLSMGGGECPNKQYKTTVVAVLEDGTVVDNVDFSIVSKSDNEEVCHVLSGESCMLYPISYIAQISRDGAQLNCPFTVKEEVGTVYINIELCNLNINIVDDLGQPVEGLSVEISSASFSYTDVAPFSVALAPGDFYYSVKAFLGGKVYLQGGKYLQAWLEIPAGKKDENLTLVYPREKPIALSFANASGVSFVNVEVNMQFSNQNLHNWEFTDDAGTIMLPYGTTDICRILGKAEDADHNIYIFELYDYTVTVDDTTDSYVVEMPGTFKKCRFHFTLEGADTNAGEISIHGAQGLAGGIMDEYYKGSIITDSNGYSPWIHVYYEDGRAYERTSIFIRPLGQLKYQVALSEVTNDTGGFDYDKAEEMRWKPGKPFYRIVNGTVYSEDVTGIGLMEETIYLSIQPDGWNGDTFEFDFSENQIS